MTEKTTNFWKQFICSSVFLAIIGAAFTFGVDRSFIRQSLTNQEFKINQNQIQIDLMKKELAVNRELLVTYLSKNVEQMHTLNIQIGEIKEQLKENQKR